MTEFSRFNRGLAGKFASVRYMDTCMWLQPQGKGSTPGEMCLLNFHSGEWLGLLLLMKG